MCSIYGAIGPHIDSSILEKIRQAAKDRGRDGGRAEHYVLENGRHIVLGNWRATPTPEIEIGPLQPYDKFVHNGTIANDKELGGRSGEIDSQALSRFVDRTDVHTLASSLTHVKGSYALACANDRTVLAAVNYKPLHYARLESALYFSSMARHFAGVLPYGHAPVAVPPYHVIDFATGETRNIHTGSNLKVVVIASSGLDSTVAATHLVRAGYDVCLLHFTYGANAGNKEWLAIPKIAKALDCKFVMLEVDLKQMLGIKASILFGNETFTTSSIEGAEYAHEWVPARNLVFIALATAWAEANGYHAVALGNNLEEAGAYPDNEEQFTTLLNQAMPYAVQAHYGMEMLSPVGNLMKHEIVRRGLELGAPFEFTWSCYRGGERHCGECGPCFMRKKAFERCGAEDPVFATR